MDETVLKKNEITYSQILDHASIFRSVNYFKLYKNEKIQNFIIMEIKKISDCKLAVHSISYVRVCALYDQVCGKLRDPSHTVSGVRVSSDEVYNPH